MRIRERFNPRAPCGVRRPRVRRAALPLYFNPRAPCGARLCWLSPSASRSLNFNPRAPCGARQRPLLSLTVWQLFQPTRPLRGATKVLNRIEDSFTISTHAPLAGRDGRKCFLTLLINVFQPTRPLRGATQRPYRVKCRHIRFQPTRPLRGATALTACHSRALNNFNPRAPCGARPRFSNGDVEALKFQPTRPLRGATF